jgi:hypothetical protein
MHDERVTFTQKRVFSLQSYKLIQRGPSFPATIDVAMERKTGEYRVQSFQDGSGSRETVHFIAFTPEPKVIELKLIAATKRTIHIGDLAKQVTQYVLEPQLNSVTMFFGKLLGKLHMRSIIIFGCSPTMCRPSVGLRALCI